MDNSRSVHDMLMSATVSAPQAIHYLKQQARNDAVKNVFYNIYRSQCRYEPKQYKGFFGLSDEDVSLIETYNQDTEYPLVLLTVNLPLDFFLNKLGTTGMKLNANHATAIKATRKIWIDECLVSFELGKEGDHPHYHYLLTKSREWVAKSRMIDEFAKTFKVEKNFIDVKLYKISQLQKIIKYVKKEEIWNYGKIKNNSRAHN